MYREGYKPVVIAASYSRPPTRALDDTDDTVRHHTPGPMSGSHIWRARMVVPPRPPATPQPAAASRAGTAHTQLLTPYHTRPYAAGPAVRARVIPYDPRPPRTRTPRETDAGAAGAGRNCVRGPPRGATT
jgi:hypothetical protein